MIPVLLALLAASSSQDAVPELLTDPAIWGHRTVEHPTLEPPPPIRIEAWQVVLGGAEATESVLARYLREPGGLEGLEWIEVEDLSNTAGLAVARARVEVEADEVRMARLPGARCLGIRGELFHGDPERKGHGGVPVALQTGSNELVVFGPTAGFELELWAPETRAVIATWAIGLPHMTRELKSWTILPVFVPVFNASVETSDLHVHYGDAVPDQDGLRPQVTEWADSHGVVALGLTVGHTFLWPESIEGLEVASAHEALFPVCSWASEEEPEARHIVRIPLAEPGTFPPPSEGESAERLRASPRRSAEQADELVYGTLGSDAETRELIARARFDQQRIWYSTGRAPDVVADRAFRNKRARGPVVLYGNQDTNAAWQQLLGETPGLFVRRGSARLGEGPPREGADLFGFALRSRADPKGVEYLVLALFDTGPVGTRRGAQVDPRNLPSDAREGFLEPGALGESH